MRKYMPVLVFLVAILTLATVVSAEDVNDTQELTDSQRISQKASTTTENYASQYYVEQTEQKSIAAENTDSVGGDCCSAIIQGYANDSTISFRRDDSVSNTINITSNSSRIIQVKGYGSYFFHAIVTNEGWIVGNGGLDNGTNSHTIENLAFKMINAKKIDNATFNQICNIKSTSQRGHFVIKAPEGNYAVFINYNGNTFKEMGILKPGEFLSVPNNPVNFVKGQYQNYTNTSQFISSSRLIAAMDKYGVERRIITTYYYKRTGNNSTVKVYVYNDDGRYVNRNTKNLVDSVQTDTRYISASTMQNDPNISRTAIQTVNFTIKEDKPTNKTKINTTITSKNITTKSENVTLKAKVVDENGKKVNSGFVSLLVNGKTVKYANGSVVYANVVKGVAEINYTLPNIWKKHNYTYYFRYYGRTTYESNLGNNATITVGNLAKLKVSHAKTTIFGTNLTIKSKVTHTANGTPVNVGFVLFKVNGKTIRNENNSTLTVNVVKGVAVFNLKLDSKYSAKKYNITVVFGYGAQRIEMKSSVMIQKIPTRIDSPVVQVKNNKVTVKAKLVDMNNKTIQYPSYIAVKVNGKTVRNPDNSTKTFNITGGIIDFTFTLPGKLKVGNHTLNLVVPELRETLSVRENVTMEIVN